jgi:hypothetical protein
MKSRTCALWNDHVWITRVKHAHVHSVLALLRCAHVAACCSMHLVASRTSGRDCAALPSTLARISRRIVHSASGLPYRIHPSMRCHMRQCHRSSRRLPGSLDPNNRKVACYRIRSLQLLQEHQIRNKVSSSSTSEAVQRQKCRLARLWRAASCFQSCPLMPTRRSNVGQREAGCRRSLTTTAALLHTKQIAVDSVAGWPTGSSGYTAAQTGAPCCACRGGPPALSKCCWPRRQCLYQNAA